MSSGLVAEPPRTTLGAVRARSGFVEGGSRAREKNVVTGPSDLQPVGEEPASCDWKAPWPTPSFVRSRGCTTAASATLDRGERLHALTGPKLATTGARDRLFRASVQPCTRSDGRLGSADPGFGLGPHVCSLMVRQRPYGQPCERAEKRITGGCARVSRRLQKSACGVWRTNFVAVVAVAKQRRLVRARVTPGSR